MILYNVTVKIDVAIHQEWLQWVKTQYIPLMLSTGLFVSHRICHLLGQDESDGVTYAIQYFCKDIPSFNLFQQKYAAKIQATHKERYENQFVDFITLLEVID